MQVQRLRKVRSTSETPDSKYGTTTNYNIMRQIENNIRITVNNVTLSYNDAGPEGAPTILFIHGFPFNKSMWNVQVETLKTDYRVITYDIRGHGNSDLGDEDFSIELFGQDLILLMDALKIEKAIVCGLSMGGYIALNAIGNYPDRFTGLVLSDTNCASDTPESKDKRMQAIESIRKNGVEKYADESLKKLFAPESFTTKLKELDKAREMITTTSKQSLYNTLHALAKREETCTKLPEINVPVLILVGYEDVITPLEAAHSMHEKIKGSFLHIINQAGHLSNLENPVEFNDQLKTFLTVVKQKSKDFPEKNQLLSDGQNQKIITSYEEAEKELNTKILKITMLINDHYPELSKYFEEMPDTIPNEKKSEITLKNLGTYYESLNSILKKYRSDHPNN